MNTSKQMDIIRKRNTDLSKRLEELQFKLDYQNQLNTGSYKTAKELITELNTIKDEWSRSLKILQKRDAEYQRLIEDLKNLRKIMISNGIKMPWYKRIYYKIKK